MPNRAVWIATGNNPALSNEIARRTVRIRLDAGTDRPWTRRNFAQDDLRAWVASRRARLIWAALTLIQAWIAAGKPDSGHRLGRFDEWARVVGAILTVAEIEGFLENSSAFYEGSDHEMASLRALIETWLEQFGQEEVNAGSLYALIASAELDLELGRGDERSRKIRLGKLLERHRDRQVGNVKIVRLPGKTRGRTMWKLLLTSR